MRRLASGARALRLMAPVVVAASIFAVVVTTQPVSALASTTTTSQASPTSAALGTGVGDTATVQGNPTSGSPTGTVTFYGCQVATTQTLTTGACANVAGNLLGIVHVAAGASNTSGATFSSFVAPSAGSWCFSTVYGGDGNYSASQDNTSSGNLDPNECFLVTTIPATISTTTTPGAMTLGSGTVSDQVKVMGSVTGGKPTGTVTFYVCRVSTSQALAPGPCPASGTPEDVGESLVTGADDVSNATSVPFTPTSAGTWCFSVTYTGNQDYSASQDNTDNANQDAGECTLVQPAPASAASTVSAATVTVGPSGTVTDTVRVTGNASGGPPTGTVVFYACETGTVQSPATGLCPTSGTPVDAGEALVAGAGDTSSATSASFAPSAGTWCFGVAYGGDANYQPSQDNASGTPDPSECVAASPVAYTIYSAATATATAGQLLSPGFEVETYPTAPVPVIRKKGHLPRGMRFVNGHNGFATITGRPGRLQAGTYPITITVTWGRGTTRHVAVQVFTLTVH